MSNRTPKIDYFHYRYTREFDKRMKDLDAKPDVPGVERIAVARGWVLEDLRVDSDTLDIGSVIRDETGDYVGVGLGQTVRESAIAALMHALDQTAR